AQPAEQDSQLESDLDLGRAQGGTAMSVSMHQSENLCDGAAQQQNIVGTGLPGMVAWTDELHLIELLRSGNEAAYVSLLDRYHTDMLRLAMVYVTTRAVAEEVVQETWMAVL